MNKLYELRKQSLKELEFKSLSSETQRMFENYKNDMQAGADLFFNKERIRRVKTAQLARERYLI